MLKTITLYFLTSGKPTQGGETDISARILGPDTAYLQILADVACYTGDLDRVLWFRIAKQFQRRVGTNPSPRKSYDPITEFLGLGHRPDFRGHSRRFGCDPRSHEVEISKNHVIRVQHVLFVPQPSLNRPFQPPGDLGDRLGPPRVEVFPKPRIFAHPNQKRRGC